MKRQFGWQPSDYTKVCSDHFHDSDFVETDVIKYIENSGQEKVTMIRLKKDAIPCTNRETGEYLDPAQSATASSRLPPKRRVAMRVIMMYPRLNKYMSEEIYKVILNVLITTTDVSGMLFLYRHIGNLTKLIPSHVKTLCTVLITQLTHRNKLFSIV